MTHKCSACGATHEFGETLRNGVVRVWQYHDCDFCKGRMTMEMQSNISPMMFRRAGWGDNVSKWEEIKWRAR